MIDRGFRYTLLLSLLFAFLIPGCASRPRDDGYVLLSRYKAQWQRPAPGHVMAAPLPSNMASAPASALGPTPVPSDPTTIITKSVIAESSMNSAPTSGSSPVLVYLDPGHGGVDTGTIGTTDDGTTVYERDLVLAVALRTADKLRQDGIGVELSRTTEALVDSVPSDYTADGTELTPDGVLDDLQKRIDRANASGAKVFLSIHMNGFTDPSVGGAETFYDPTRPFGAKNKQFATLIQDDLIAAYQAHGYDIPDRGVADDTQLQAESLGSLPDYDHLVMLGPGVPGRLRPTEMPGALSESLFLTNPAEATAADTPAVQDLIASAFTQAIEQFLKANGLYDGATRNT